MPNQNATARRLSELYSYCERHKIKPPSVTELARWWHKDRDILCAVAKTIPKPVWPPQEWRDSIIARIARGRAAGRTWEGIAVELEVSPWVLRHWRERYLGDTEYGSKRAYRWRERETWEVLWRWAETGPGSLSSRAIARELGVPAGSVAGVLTRYGMYPRERAKERLKELVLVMVSGFPLRKRSSAQSRAQSHYIYVPPRAAPCRSSSSADNVGIEPQSAARALHA